MTGPIEPDDREPVSDTARPTRKDRRSASRTTASATATPGRIVVIAIVAVLALVAIGLQVFLPGPSDPKVTPLPVAAVPVANATDVQWFCAEGTSNPGGRADETVLISNRGDRDAAVSVEVHVDGATQRRDYTVEASGQQRVRVADIAASPEPGVTVTARGGQVVVEHFVTGSDDVALGPCARRASAEWNFAAGTTVKGAFEWLSVYNPYPESALVDIDVLSQDVNGDVTIDRQPERIESINVPGRTRRSIAVHEKLGRYTATAVIVRARYGRVVAERTLIFDNVGGRKGLAVSLGTPDLGTSFVFPDGRAGEGRSEVIAVANPGNGSAEVEVQSLFEGGITIDPVRVTVSPKTVVNVPTPGAPKDLRRVMVVTSSAPVVAELRVTAAKPQPAAGIATMVGEQNRSRQWTFAAARLSATSLDKYRIYNPGSKSARVNLTLLGARNPDGPEYEIAPGGVVLVDAKDLGLTPAVTLIVNANRPVIAARVTDATGITISAGMPTS